jgi:hypothetical protein
VFGALDVQRIRPAIAIAFSFCLLSGGVARAAPTCESQVLRDWSRDGRIDRVYQLPCYEGAIDLLPTDLRDYTDAEDVIERALASAIRQGARDTAKPNTTSAARTDRGDASPSLLLATLGGMALALLAAGGLGYLSRRRSPVHADDLSDDDTL